MAGLREFVVQFGTEEQCIEHLAGLRRICLCRVWRTPGMAAEGAPASVRMRGLPSAGIDDRWNGISPDADRADQVVSRRLSNGLR